MSPYSLEGRELPEGGTDNTPTPCILCGVRIRHFNSGLSDALGWNLHAVYKGRTRTFRYHNEPCIEPLGADHPIWRCTCVPDYIENVGPRCGFCGTPKPPGEEYAVPFIRVAPHELGMSLVTFPDRRVVRVPDKYARKLARLQGHLDWHRRATSPVLIKHYEKWRALKEPMTVETLLKTPWGLGYWSTVQLGAGPALLLPTEYARALARALARYVVVEEHTFVDVYGPEGPKPFGPTPTTQGPRPGSHTNARLVLTLGDLRRATAHLPDDTFVVLDHPSEPAAYGRWRTAPAVEAVVGRHTTIDLDYPFVPEGGTVPPGESFPAVALTAQRRPLNR